MPTRPAPFYGAGLVLGAPEGSLAVNSMGRTAHQRLDTRARWGMPISMKTTLVAPIAIDLGTVSTGLVTGVIDSSSGKTVAPLDASVIQINKDTFTASLYARRVNRHMRRNMKRRRLAKRLFEVLLKDHFKVDVSQFTRLERERLRSLFNRRGYTFLGSEGENITERIEPSLDLINRIFLGSALLPQGGFISARQLVATFEERGEEFPTLISTDLALAAINDLAASLSPAPKGLLSRVSDPAELKSVCTHIQLLKQRFNGPAKRKVILTEADRKLLHDCEIEVHADEFYGNDLKTLSKKVRKISLFPIVHPDIMAEIVGASDDRLEGLRAVQSLVTTILESVQTGHKPRATYFREITKELCETSDPFLKALPNRLNLEAGVLARLIGHISNLQLRVLRKYFNSVEFKATDRWDEERFGRLFWRYVKAWRPETSDERNKIYALRSWAKSNQGKGKYSPVLKLWLETEPTTTIPPFEDQNNRRPPTCQSLILVSDVLSRELPLWESILLASVQCDPAFYDEFRESGVSPDGKVKAFQRLLDRSKSHDPLMLRRLCRIEVMQQNDPRTEHELRSAYDSSRLDIGFENYRAFLRFAARYYDLCDEAARSSWFAETQTEGLIRVCDSKVRLKKNDLGAILAQVFGVSQAFWSDEVIIALKAFASTEKIGRRTLSSFFAQCFKEKDERGEQALAEAIADVKRNPKADKKLHELVSQSETVASSLCRFMGEHGLSETTLLDPARFANLFTLGQLHSHLFNDVNGFSSACACCNRENATRLIQYSFEGGNAARAKRLPALPTRPFNGILRALLSKTAATIGQHVTGRIPHDAEKVVVPIIIEENSFEWAAGIKQFAPTGTSLKSGGAGETRALRKVELLRTDSREICPYTGQKLEKGELDHIVPRSLTQNIRQTTINGAVNLIFCSREGNALKSNKEKGLADLHSRYLEVQFGSSSPSAVREIIENGLAKIPELRGEGDMDGVRDFTSLSTEERRVVKHALFVPELRSRILGIWARGNIVSRVNGTQNYLGRLLVDQLSRRLKGRASVVPVLLPVRADEVSVLRRYLASRQFGHALFHKSEPQTVYSHAVDAFCALLLGLESKARRSIRRDIYEAMSQARDALGIQDDTSIETLRPKSLRVYRVGAGSALLPRRMHGKSLTKGTMYGTRFLPLLVGGDGRMGFGFSPENWVEVQEQPNKKNPEASKEKLFRGIRPFLAGASVPESFDAAVELAKQSSRSYRLFRLSASAIIEHFHLFSQGQVVGESDSMIKVLEGLRYSITKTPVTKETLDPKIMKHLSFPPKIGLRGYKFIGAKVTIPVAKVWEELIERFGHLEDPSGALRAYWSKSRQRGGGQVRRTARRGLALPLLDDPSGGIRVGSNNPITGERVWRTVAPAKMAYRGLCIEADEGRPVLGDPVPLFASKRIHSLTPDAGPSCSDASILPFGARLEIPLGAGKEYERAVITVTEENRGIAELTLPLASLGEGFESVLELFTNVSASSDDNPNGLAVLPVLKEKILEFCRRNLGDAKPRNEKGEFSFSLLLLSAETITVALTLGFNGPLRQRLAEAHVNSRPAEHAAPRCS